jgi:syntaxin 1A/syntaxin 1B/2/3
MRDRTLDLGTQEPQEPQEQKKKKKKNEPVQTDMNQFFEEIAEMKERIASIKGCIDEIRSIHDKTLNSVISEQQNAEIGRELDQAMDKTNKLSQVIRTKLKEMDQVNKQLQKKDPSGNDTTIRVAQHGVLTKNFLEVMTDYKKLQEQYQSKFKDRMQRQALIVKPNATKEEVEKMIDGEQGQMFAKQIVNSRQRQEATKALEDIQNKHKDIVKIEKSILELQQLFMDMAVLVAAQGEVIDQIAVHIDHAVADTEEGVQQLQKAVKLQKKSRKVFIINVENVCYYFLDYRYYRRRHCHYSICRWY